MKSSTFADKIRRIVSGLKFNYAGAVDDSELGKVDFGVLTVAMMIAAIDGVILPTELSAFSRLAKQCRVSEDKLAANYDDALHAAGYIMLMSRSGLSEKALLQTFLREAERVLPSGFAGTRLEDVRRALVIWVAMGMSDGDFCGLERKCIEAFRDRIIEIMRKRRDTEEELWRGLSPTFQNSYMSGRRLPCKRKVELEPDFMSTAEKLVLEGNTAAIRKFILKG